MFKKSSANDGSLRGQLEKKSIDTKRGLARCQRSARTFAKLLFEMVNCIQCHAAKMRPRCWPLEQVCNTIEILIRDN